jgi:8-amino-7-oxononanoate synthase
MQAFRGRLVSNARIDAVPSAAEVESDGSRMVVASTDDVLGLGSDPRVREAMTAAARKYGTGRMAEARLVGEFEERLASTLESQHALVINHESALLEQLPLGRMATHVRRMRPLSHAVPVASVEEADAALGRPGMVGLILEAVHRLEGDLALMPRFAEVCQRHHQSLVVIDDGLGVLGPSGGGAVEHLSVGTQVTLRVLPLGHAIPGSGAVVVGDAELIETMRGVVPPPPATALATSLRAVQIAIAEDTRRLRAFDLAQRLLTGLRALGFDTGPCVTPWVPIWLGDETLCEQWLSALASLGIFCRAWRSGPRSRLLLSPPATLSDPQLAQILEAFERLSRKLAPPQNASLPKEAPTVARPGSYAMSAKAALHWSTVDRPEPLTPDARHDTEVGVPPSSFEKSSVKDRVYDAVETLTWKATNAGGNQLRRGAAALRALLDRRGR